jgi:hypothetical protein
MRRAAPLGGTDEPTEVKMSNEVIRVFALPHLGAEREIIVMKEKGQNVHAFPPYAKKSLAVLICLSSVRAGRRGEAANRLVAVRKTAELIAAG